MKKYLIPFLFLFFVNNLTAQSPPFFNYQTIIRDHSGQVMVDKNFYLRISIYQNDINGNLVFQELHHKTTNKYGLINLQIGNGVISMGSIQDLNWSAGPYFLETAIDSTENQEFVIISTTQLLSVPYAMHAHTVDVAGVWEQNNNDIYYQNGNVGIGTSQPTTPLQIEGYSEGTENKTFAKIINHTNDPWSAANVRFFSGTNQENFLQLAHRADSYSVMEGYAATSLVWNRGNGLILQSTDSPNSSIRFQTSTLHEYIERMRLDAEGNLGLGTKAPEYPLHITRKSVLDGNRTLIYLYNPSLDHYSGTSLKLAAGNKNGSLLALGHTSDTYSILPGRHNISYVWNKGRGLSLRSTNSDEASILFETSSNEEIIERMRIDVYGNIGIGTSNPHSKLHLSEGDLYIEQINSGIIMKSPDGQCWKITVNNDGSLSTQNISCP